LASFTPFPDETLQDLFSEAESALSEAEL